MMRERDDQELIDLQALVGRLAGLIMSRQQLTQDQRYLTTVRSLLSSQFSFEGLLNKVTLAAPRVQTVSVEYAGNFKTKAIPYPSRDMQNTQENGVASDASKIEEKIEYRNKNPNRKEQVPKLIKVGSHSSTPKLRPEMPNYRRSMAGQEPHTVFPNVGFLMQKAFVRIAGLQDPIDHKKGKVKSPYSFSSHSERPTEKRRGGSTKSVSTSETRVLVAINSAVRGVMSSSYGLGKLSITAALAQKDAVRIMKTIRDEWSVSGRNGFFARLAIENEFPTNFAKLGLFGSVRQFVGIKKLGDTPSDSNSIRQGISISKEAETIDQGEVLSSSTTLDRIARGGNLSEGLVRSKVMQLPGVISRISANLPLWGHPRASAANISPYGPVTGPTAISTSAPFSKRNRLKTYFREHGLSKIETNSSVSAAMVGPTQETKHVKSFKDSLMSSSSLSPSSVFAEGRMSITSIPRPPVYRIISRILDGLSRSMPLRFALKQQQAFFSPDPSYAFSLKKIGHAESLLVGSTSVWSMPLSGLRNILAGNGNSISPSPRPLEMTGTLSNIIPQEGGASSSDSRTLEILPGQDTGLTLPALMLSLQQAASVVSGVAKRKMAQTLGFVIQQGWDNKGISRTFDRLNVQSRNISPSYAESLFVPNTAKTSTSTKPSTNDYKSGQDPENRRNNLADLASWGDNDKVGDTMGTNSLIKPISRLNQVYFRYTFGKFTRISKTYSSKAQLSDPNSSADSFSGRIMSGSSGALVLASNSAVSNPKVGLHAKKYDAINAARTKRMKDGSEDLPNLSQLQTILVNSSVLHAAHNFSQSALEVANSQPMPSPIPLITPRGSTKPAHSALQAQESRTIGFGQTIGGRRSNEQSSFGKRDVVGQGSRIDYSKREKNEKSTNNLSLRDLRRMMEQIFQDELKRYGL